MFLGLNTHNSKVYLCTLVYNEIICFYYSYELCYGLMRICVIYKNI